MSAEIDFKESELHVRIDRNASEGELVRLTFFHDQQWHDMNRPLHDSLQKTLKRLTKNIQKSLKGKKKGKKARPEAADCDEEVVTLLLGAEPVDTATCTNADFQTGMVVQFHQLSFNVVLNPPTVTHIASFPRAHFTVGYPIAPVIALDYATHFNCSWYHEVVPQSHSYELVCQDLVFTPGPGSIGRRLKLIATPVRDEPDHRQQGRSMVFYLSNEVKQYVRSTVPRMLQVREDFHSSAPSTPSAPAALRIMSYNILSEGYAQKETSSALYWYCCESYLEMEYRAQLIAAELLACKAAVLALQECDKKLFDLYLLPLLGAAGYDGHYTNKVAMVQEGCAIFLLRSAVTAVQFIDIPYKAKLTRRHSALAITLYDARPDLEDILGGKLGTVAQIAVVRVNGSNRLLCLANTHLFYHPMASYLRLLQAHTLTSCLEDLVRDISCYYETHSLPERLDSSEAYQRPSHLFRSYFEDAIDLEYLLQEHGRIHSLGSAAVHTEGSYEMVANPDREYLHVTEGGAKQVDVSAIIMGDFNSTPSSAAFEFLATGKVSASRLRHSWKDLQNFSWGHTAHDTAVASLQYEEEKGTAEIPAEEQDEEQGPIARSQFTHSLHLIDSAHSEGYHKRYSNFTPDFKELLDYIFIQHQAYKVKQVAPLPSLQEMEEETALPSSCFPSDHVSIVVDIETKR